MMGLVFPVKQQKRSEISTLILKVEKEDKSEGDREDDAD